MNLKKKIILLGKRKTVSSRVFFFQTRTDLVLVMFYYNAAVRRFPKTFRKFPGKRLWWNHFYESLSYSKWTQVRASFYQFSEHLFIVASKHWTETQSFEWYHCLVQILQSHQKSIKKLKLFLLNAPKYFGARPFYSLYAQTLRVFWNVFLSKKNPWNLKVLFVKVSPLRIS